MGVDFIILGFATVDGFHIKGLAENEGDVLLNTEICDPAPRKEKGTDLFYQQFQIANNWG